MRGIPCHKIITRPLTGRRRPLNILGQVENNRRPARKTSRRRKSRETAAFTNHVVPGKLHIFILSRELGRFVVPTFYRRGVLEQPPYIDRTVFLVAETQYLPLKINIATALLASRKRGHSAYVATNYPCEAPALGQQANGLRSRSDCTAGPCLMPHRLHRNIIILQKVELVLNRGFRSAPS